MHRGPKRASHAPPEAVEENRRSPFHKFHKDSLPDPLVGVELEGRYRLVSRIGAGGTSSVYGAVDGQDGGKVAVKIAYPRLDLGTMNSLIGNEHSVLARLSHENIIRTLGEGEHGGRRYVLLEYVGGETLYNEIEMGRRMSWARARNILLQVCSALDHVHSAGLVHRDVKPGNILLSGTPGRERAKLIDFGLAHEPGSRDLVPSTMAAGTATYMAPEIILQDKFDRRADIYALGVVMYKILVGIAPFSGSNRDVLLMHVSQAPEPPREVHPYLHIPNEIEDIVMKALEKDPGMRFSDARAMGQAIAECTFWPTEIGLMEGMEWGRILNLA